MIADVPLGCFLSGGIDSSLISAIAQQESNTKLKTFSIGFDEEFYNEAIYAEKVAAHIGSEHKSLIISEKDCFPIIEKLPFIYDEPFADSSALPTFLVSQLAKKDVTIALSGDGGDELFYGYERYIYISKIYNLIKKVPRSMAPFISTCCKIAPTSKLKRLLYYINLYLSTGAPHQLYNWSISNFNKKELYNLLGDNYSDQDIFNHMAKKFNSKINTVEELFPLLDIKSYLTDDILTKVDRASMANSLEARVPLLDHRIVEFAISTPFALKYHQNTPKHLLRQLLSKHVPNKLIDRPKTGFSIPLNKWLNGNLKYLINQYLEKGLIQQQNIFNYDFIENEKKILASRKYDNSSRVWTILMFQLWYYEWIKN
jgi:asparagine synthase (glutamine-hydrolysing)